MQTLTRRRAEPPATATPAQRSRLRLVWLAALGLGTAAFGAVPDAALQLDAPSVFKRVQASTQHRSFVGTYVVSSGGAMSSSRIVHYCNGNEQIDKIESLDGQMQRIYRHNELVHIFWPQTHEVSIEARDLMGRWPGPPLSSSPGSVGHNRAVPPPPATALNSPSASYEAVAGRLDRVAGYDAQIVTLQPKDSLRYGQRWWLERESGLLLRNELLSPRGEVLESAGFSELQIGVKLHAPALLQEMNRLQGYRLQQASFHKTKLEQEGWTLKRTVAGFRPYACVRRAAPSPAGHESKSPEGAAVHTASGGPMLQAIYTDGLTHVSLFIERYDAGRHAGITTQAIIGATQVVTRRDGDWWITAVGEVPTGTLQAFSQGLERLKP